MELTGPDPLAPCCGKLATRSAPLTAAHPPTPDSVMGSPQVSSARWGDQLPTGNIWRHAMQSLG